MLKSRSVSSRMILTLILTAGLLIFMMLNRYLFDHEKLLQTAQTPTHLLLAASRIFIGIFFALWAASLSVKFLNTRYQRDNFRRWVIQFLIVLGMALTLTYIQIFFLKTFKLEMVQQIKGPLFVIMFLINFVLGLTFFSIMEIWDMIEQNQALQVHLAKAEKDKLRSQVHALQQQVNPHFMFNSLNVLSELIYEDTRKADAFINEFSKVYRYVLDLNEETVVRVEQELAFLQSYLFLQQIRFGESLSIEKEIPERVLHQLIPPLSLQLLFENAIKHNRISKTEPLRIHLTEKEGYLEVRNNLQIRKDLTSSRSVGLQNLIDKYELLSEQIPNFLATEKEFIAKIPLISPQS